MHDSVLKRTADSIRILSLSMVEKAQSGHPGGAMGGADFIAVLFGEFLCYDPLDSAWPFRDRFFLDPGHMSPMLYSILMLTGHFTIGEIRAFRQWGSPTTGHPELDVGRGIENTSGPLGLGHAMACGAAIAERMMAQRFGEWTAHKTYAYISDGGIQEEISQGVGRIAGHLGLSNLIMFFDSNDIQLSTGTNAVTSEDTAKKYESWGWRVETIDGNDIAQIRAALRRAVAEKAKPTLIIGKTVMGKGAKTEKNEGFERQVSTHGQPLSKAGGSVARTIESLGGDPADPFAVFPDVLEHFAGIQSRKAAEAEAFRRRQAEWEAANPLVATRLKAWLLVEPPAIDFRAIRQKPDVATRSASGAVLAHFAETIDTMIVCSADLANSDKTEDFLAKTTPLARGDFSGKFLHAGVSELTMAALCNGLALHGMIPVCGTFFVFSDYMKPAIRLAALMALPVKYVWTHDSFRVGEDGPTHQPIEQEAQIRLLEKIRNHRGEPAIAVLRPADAAETTVSWKIALENTRTPTALILSRQNMTDIPALAGSRFDDALQARRGAYIVVEPGGEPDLVLLANGSEVFTLIKAAALLTADMGLKVRVVSAPSAGLFIDQPVEYRQAVLPSGVPTLGLSAGLPESLSGLAGPLAKVVGMRRFGASAPYTVLEENFGYTPARVVAEVATYLEEYRRNLSDLQVLKSSCGTRR
jgi:transketolase